MNIPKIWKEHLRVLTFNMDPKGKSHLTSICNFLQEGASLHAEHAGFGFENMMKRNQVWVLTRLKVVIEKYPVWKDKILLNTWSRGKEGIFHLRDFTINDIENKPIINATSSWAAINYKTRRPGIVEGLENGIYSLKDKKALNEKLEKLPELKKPVILRKRKIEYTDIDLLYHVNNVKYIELLINSFPIELLSKQSIYSMEINYLGEAKIEDNVIIQSEKIDKNIFLTNVVRESDQKELCRARFFWK